VPTPEELRDRTKAFALRVIRLYRALPAAAEAQIIGKQLLRLRRIAGPLAVPDLGPNLLRG